jgi:hypothetical protein
VFVGSNPTLSAIFAVVVARIGFSATTSRESRQGRKAAAAATMSGAGVSADTGYLLLRLRRTSYGCAELSWGIREARTPEELRREDAPGR